MVKSYLLFVFIAIHFICKKSFTIFTLFCFVFWIFSSQLDKILKKKTDNKMYFIPIKSIELFHFYLSGRRMFCGGCYKFAFVVIPKEKVVF